MQAWVQSVKLFFDEEEFKSVKKINISLKKYQKIALNECKEILKNRVETYRKLKLNSISFGGGEECSIIFKFYYEANRMACDFKFS